MPTDPDASEETRLLALLDGCEAALQTAFRELAEHDLERAMYVVLVDRSALGFALAAARADAGYGRRTDAGPIAFVEHRSLALTRRQPGAARAVLSAPRGDVPVLVEFDGRRAEVFCYATNDDEADADDPHARRSHPPMRGGAALA